MWKNALTSSAATIIATATLLLSYPLYIRLLGYSEFGIWLILATVLTAAQITNLGLGQAVMKLTAEEYHHEGEAGARSYVLSALAICLLITGILTISLATGRAMIIRLFSLHGEGASWVAHFLPYVGLLTGGYIANDIVQGAISGGGRMDISSGLQAGYRIADFLISLVLIHLHMGKLSLLISDLIATPAVLLIGVSIVFRHSFMCRDSIALFTYKRVRALVGLCAGLFGTSTLVLLLGPLNKAILSRAVGVQAIPIYDLSYTGSMNVRAIIESGVRAWLPKVSALAAVGNNRRALSLGRIYRTVWVTSCAIGVPVFAAVYATDAPLLRLLLQQRYTDGVTKTFNIMLLAAFLSLLVCPAYYSLIGTGRVIECVVASLFLVVGDAASIALGCYMGVPISSVTVAVGVVVGTGCSGIWLALRWQRVLGRLEENGDVSGRELAAISG